MNAGRHWLNNPSDSTAYLAYYNMIEANVTILCVALIASKPVIMYLLPDPLMDRIRARFVQRWTRQSKSKSKASRASRILNRNRVRNMYGQTVHLEVPSETPSLDMLETLTLGPIRESYETAGHAGTPHRIRPNSEEALVVPTLDHNGIIRTHTIDKRTIPGGSYGAPVPGGKL